MRHPSSRRKGRRIIAALLSGVLLLLAVVGGVNLAFWKIGSQKQYGVPAGEAWEPAQPFDPAALKQLDMGDRPFKILLLTDIHLKNRATFAAFLGVNYVLDWAGEAALDRLMHRVRPDLVLVLGDIVLTDRNDSELSRFIRQMDGYQTPWACVFGNHDDEGRVDKARLAELLQQSENGLFEPGPADLHGIGNYVIRLTRGGETRQLLFLMDSGSSLEFPRQTDGINEKQVAWYRWNMEGIAAAEGTMPQNLAFFHIPLPAYSALSDFEQGERAEDTCPAHTDAGLLDAMRQDHGTHVFAAHDHNNNFIARQDGIKLGYVMKSSYNCYFKPGMTGGTLLTIHPDDKVTEELVYFSGGGSAIN